MKGIILAAGLGTRLYPSTIPISKQLLNIYDKPMIYYPFSILMLAGVKNIGIISTSSDLPLFQKLFYNGDHLGIDVDYFIQDSPKGIADAFLVTRGFIGDDNVILILGDNVFYSPDMQRMLSEAVTVENKATVFACEVENPKAFGIVELDDGGNPISIEEKPEVPKSNYAVTGCYFYPNDVVSIVEDLEPSARGELEITAVNNEYLMQDRLNVMLLGQNTTWFDTGTHDAILRATDFVKNMQTNFGVYIGCLEEIAYRQGYIDKNQLRLLSEKFRHIDYGRHIFDLSNS